MAGRGESRVEAAVFGTDDPAAIARSADDLCRTHLGSRVADARFYCASVGCVTGLRLTDRRDVVLKVHQPRWTSSFLAAVRSVQASLATTDYSGEIYRRDGRRVAPGTRVEARVGGTLCGVASTRRTGSFAGYVLSVVGEAAVPGCRSGARVTFRIDGDPAVETVVNGREHGGALDLTVR